MDGMRPSRRPNPSQPQPASSQPYSQSSDGMDIRPQRPAGMQATPLAQNMPQSVQLPAPTPLELPVIEPLTPPTRHKRSLKKAIIGAVIAVVVVGILALVAGFIWYNQALSPVSASSGDRIRVTIESGSGPAAIANLLHEKKLIHSPIAFDIYTKLAKNRNDLKAGSFALSPSQTLPEIVDTLVAGKAESFNVTFFPGGTLRSPASIPKKQRTDAQTVLLNAGFTQEEITAAFSKQYSGSLFAGRPAGASVEGYIYGDTYTIDSTTTVEQLLQMSFDEYADVLQKNNLTEGFKAQGLTLHQGIIMASVIQSEMGALKADMAQVAQVFFKRYNAGDPLGSDVTAYYGADLKGVPRAVTVDTPYNTRIHPGLPQGPISSPGLDALKAVAHPAPGNYMYFLTGDDQKNYFATTLAEHERNIADHCKIGCSIQ